MYEVIPLVCVHVDVYNWMFRGEAMKWVPFQKPLFVLASFSSLFLLIIWRTLACAWCPSKWEEPLANCAPLFKPSVIALQKRLQSPACCPCFCLSNSCVEVGCIWSSSRRRAAKIMREGARESENASHREWEKEKWQPLVQDAINNQFGIDAQETAWLALSSLLLPHWVYYVFNPLQHLLREEAVSDRRPLYR